MKEGIEDAMAMRCPPRKGGGVQWRQPKREAVCCTQQNWRNGVTQALWSPAKLILAPQMLDKELQDLPYFGPKNPYYKPRPPLFF